MLGSLTFDATLAVLVIEPVFWGRTLIVASAPPPLAIVPSGHVTVPLVCEHVPCEGIAESKVTPAGRVSVSCTPVAARGPALPTVRM